MIARRQAFTLIELLVVMAIGITLVAILMPVVSSSRNMARMAREQSSGRSLMLGVFNYANDHEGEIIHGYCRHPMDVSELPIKPSNPEEWARYPLRLLKYIGDYDKRVIVADSKGWYTSLEDTTPYFISLFPSFGINAIFVGGDESGSDAGGLRPVVKDFDRYGKFCLTRMGEAQSPSRQIVFVSARASDGGQSVSGYFKVVAPRSISSAWAGGPFTEDSPAANFGFVDFRYNSKAVVAHLDGHVEMLNEEQLRDMRRWSDLAARADDPNHSGFNR